MENNKKVILFLISLLIPIIILTIVRLPTPVADKINLADYLLLYDQKSVKGNYLDLISIDQEGQEYSSRFKDSLSVESIAFEDYIALIKGDNFYLIDINNEQMIRIKTKGSVDSVIIVNNNVYFAFQDPNFNGWRSQQVCQLTLSDTTTYDKNDYTCTDGYIKENETRFSILKTIISENDLSQINENDYVSYLINDFKEESETILTGTKLVRIDSMNHALMIYDLDENFMESIALDYGDYESVKIVNNSNNDIVPIEYFKSGNKLLKFFDIRNNKFLDYSYQYGPSDPLIAAHVLSKS